MISKRISLLACLACVLLILSPSTLFSQMAGTGQIDGTLTDRSGGAVAGATVTLVDAQTNITRTATTNDAGRYVFASVAPGTYNLTISKAGFRVARFSQQEIQVGSTRTLNATLEIGATTETVEVTATSADLQTMNATVGNTISGLALNSLPTIGRDVSTFVTLQPGVAPDGSVAGAIYDQNSFQLDGGNNSNDMDGSMNIYTPSAAGDSTGGLVTSYVTGNAGGGPTGVMPTPIDSIEELKVGTNNQTADFNSSAGAQVQMVTKRGTSNWHGTLYEYYYDNNWNGNTWDNNANGAPRDSFHYNRFGAAGGGPVIWKDILGGKWYFFGNYEGFRWPNTTTFYRTVPSDLMRQGILQFKDSSGVVQQYNLSGQGTMALCPGAANPTGPDAVPCDPRGLGITPTMQALWKFEPEPTPGASCGPLGSRCDGLNTQAFRGTLALPWNENFGVARLDHDFGSKWHFSATYHYYNLQRFTTSQVDIGGFFPGDKSGVPTSVHKRPQQPSYLTAGITTNITSNLTNDFHYSYLRNYWARYFTGGQGPGGPGVSQQPQLPDLGGALQPQGETSSNVLAPYNLDTQRVRTRFWDGQDHMIRDDVSWIKGTHFLQFGGTYQHNFNWHLRTDNGGFINNEIVYDLASGGSGTGNGGLGTGVDMTGYVPNAISAVGGGRLKNWYRDYAILLGIPSVTQVSYTRTAPDLAVQPVGAPVFDQSTIPFYNLYFSDSWRMKPSFTLTYGLGWTLEMPPFEKTGKQIVLVGPDNKPLSTEAYLKSRENAALAGQVFNPDVGFSLVHNVAGHPKYPYNPYYKSFSPRIAAAWNPNFDSGLLGDLFGHRKTVIRGGYSILYGRLNGVALLLTPLLSTGLIQAVQCFSPLMDGTCSQTSSTPANAWRIGPHTTPGSFDGLVAPITPALPKLPQPDFPGVNAVNAGASEALDANFRPSMSHQYDLTVQRQINNKTTIEFGYIGRRYNHDVQAININAVPYMMTLGGQTFAKAYGQMVMQYCGGAAGLAGGNCGGPAGQVAAPNSLTPQPFFETALGGAKSPYCAAFASCTAAVAANEGVNGTGNIPGNNVWSLWSDLDNGAFIFQRSMMNTPIPGTTPCPGSPATDPPCGASGQLTSGIGVDASLGYGNYNAGFVSLKMSDWHGLTMQSNFTYGKALGTGSIVQATSEWTVPDAYHLRSAYGLQSWDRKFIYNLFFVYQPSLYRSQHGVVGKIVGGWSIAPILSIGSGLPNPVLPADGILQNFNQTGGGQAWGQSDGVAFSSYENAINMCGSGVGGSSRHNNPVPSQTYPDMGSAFYTGGPNMFQNPEAVYNCFRNPILGIDGNGGGGAGVLRGQMYWNVDLGVRKDILITERVHLQFDANFTNIFNHPILGDPYNLLGDTADWGALGGVTGELITGAVQANAPRTIQLGLRLSF